jgi:AraC family transcriptional regulator
VVIPKVSHGQSSTAVVVGNFRLTEASYAPDQSVARHEHAFPSWTLVKSGAVEESFSRETHLCAAGSVLSKPSTADHANRYGSAGASCVIIELLKPSDTAGELAGDAFERPKTFTDGLVPRITRSIDSAMRAADSIRELVLEGLLIELTCASSRLSATDRIASRKGWLNLVRDRLDADFRSPPTLTELARSVDVHAVYLCTEFRAAFGMSVGEYARRVRFEWARNCLRLGESSIVDIALAAGFSDQAHFSRDFKARTGTSPLRYTRAL